MRAQREQRRWLRGFERPRADAEQVHLTKEMGTAFSRGDGSHLQTEIPARAHAFVAETQSDNLRPELVIEVMDHEEEHWNADPETGLVKVDAPEDGKMVRIRVTGQALVYVGVGGKVVVDDRGY